MGAIAEKFTPEINAAITRALPPSITKESKVRATDIITRSIQELAVELLRQKQSEMKTGGTSVEPAVAMRDVTQALNRFDTDITEPEPLGVANDNVEDTGIANDDTDTPPPPVTRIPSPSPSTPPSQQPVTADTVPPETTPTANQRQTAPEISTPPSPPETTSLRREPTAGIQQGDAQPNLTADNKVPDFSLEDDELPPAAVNARPQPTDSTVRTQTPQSNGPEADPATTTSSTSEDTPEANMDSTDSVNETTTVKQQPFQPFSASAPTGPEGQFAGTELGGGEIGTGPAATNSVADENQQPGAEGEEGQEQTSQNSVQPRGTVTQGVNKLRFWRDINSINKEIKDLGRRKRPLDKQRKNYTRELWRLRIVIWGLKVARLILRIIEILLDVVGLFCWITIILFELGAFLWGLVPEIRLARTSVKAEIKATEQLMHPIQNKLKAIENQWKNLDRRIALLARRRNELQNASIAGVSPDPIP